MRIPVLAAAVAAASFLFPACVTTVPSTTTAQEAQMVRQADVKALEEALRGDGVVLIDVRTPGEFAAGHVPGARNIPLSEVPSHVGELSGLEEGEELWLICRSGARSARAAGVLADAGIASVNVQGGTLAWQAAGKRVE